jgi:hypothetical protein
MCVKTQCPHIVYLTLNDKNYNDNKHAIDFVTFGFVFQAFTRTTTTNNND